MFSLEELFTPNESIKIDESEPMEMVADTHKKLTRTNFISRGYWGLTTNYDTEHNE